MGGLFGGGGAPAPIPPPAVPSRSDAEVRAEALAARQRRAAATGRSDTIITSGQGVKEDSNAASTKLLGEG
jgi:hypothetical protein